MLAVRQRPTGIPVGRGPTCFHPDGSTEPSAFPCASEGESHCCRASGICLSNGYCMDYVQPFAIWRGSCTDKTWGSDRCPKVCTGRNYLDQSVRLSIWDANSSATQYCCGDADTTQTNKSLACIDGSPTFELPDATPLLGVAGLLNAEDVSSTNSTSNTSGTATPAVTTAADQTDCSTQRQDTITVGSVLGVSLVAVAIALVLWAVWERRQKILWWQRAIGLAPQFPPENATWMREPSQNSKPPPCPITRAMIAYAAHQQQKSTQAQTAEQAAPMYGINNEQSMVQTQISSPQRPREMPDGIPAAAEMDAT